MELDPAGAGGLDGAIAFGASGVAGLDLTPSTQISGGAGLERAVARQFVRLLIDPNDDAFQAATAGGTFHGGHVDALTGGAGLAVNAARTGLAEDFLIATAGGPNAGGFVNSPAFSPAEAAPVKDLGVPLFFDVNSLGYLDGDGTTQRHSFSHSFGGFDGKAIWTLNGGNRALSVRGGTSGSGNGSAHIRVQGAADQTVGSTLRFEAGSLAEVSGRASVAVLFAGGANHALVNRGTIIAEGAEAVGSDAIAVDPGDAAPVFNGSTYDLVTFGSKQTGQYLVDRMDLGGTVSSHLGDAVRIGNGGSVREINLLSGLNLVGDLTSDGFAGATDGGAGLGAIAAPRLTFGRKTGADGRATDLSENFRDNFDGDFALDYAGDIGGATGFDAEVHGGSTHLRGDVAFNSILLEAGSLQTHGALTVAPKRQSADSGPADLVATRVKRGMLAVSGTTDLGGVRLEGGDGWAGQLVISGDARTGALDQFGGSVLADVDITHKLGVLLVKDGGSLTTKDVRNAGTVTVEKGGALTADSLTLTDPDAKLDLAGDLSIGGFADLEIGGRLDVDGKFNAHSLTLLKTAKVTGSGKIDTPLLVAKGLLAPGNSPGTLTVSGDYRSTPTAVYEIEVVPTADPVAGTDNDLIKVDGDAEVDGGTLRVLRWGTGRQTRKSGSVDRKDRKFTVEKSDREKESEQTHHRRPAARRKHLKETQSCEPRSNPGSPSGRPPNWTPKPRASPSRDLVLGWRPRQQQCRSRRCPYVEFAHLHPTHHLAARKGNPTARTPGNSLRPRHASKRTHGSRERDRSCCFDQP